MAKKTTPANLVLAQGVNAFPENQRIIQSAHARVLTAKVLLQDFHPKYHGLDKPGCLLVRVRKELVNGDFENPHFLHIYGCLTCGLNHECLHSGWEIGWFGGTESRKLSNKVKHAK